jgi:hypothetical protein
LASVFTSRFLDSAIVLFALQLVVLTEAIVKKTSCGMIVVQCFGCPYGLHLRGRSFLLGLLFNLEGGGSRFFGNVDIFMLDYTVESQN